MLGATASVTMTLGDATGNPISSLFTGVLSQGAHSFAWNEVGVPDGRYSLTVTAQSTNGKQATGTTTFYVDRTLSHVKLAAPAISPNGDGVLDATAVSFDLSGPAAVQLELWRGKKLLGPVFAGQEPAAGAVGITWDGKLGAHVVADGSYSLVLKVTDSVTTVAQTLPVVVDTTPPRLQLVYPSRLLFWSSEKATVTVRYGTRRVTKTVRRGYFGLPFLRGVGHFTLVATDALGNKSKPLRR
jgi:flagellar hook assembly protein FlgD